MTINYILNVTTLEELKKEYKRLAMIHHPDCGGDTEIMKIINNEYDFLFEQLKNTHKNKDGEYYTKENDTETPDEWKDIIESLISLNMQGVVIEIIGSFVWISGNTKPYKDEIKELGFKCSMNKIAWYLAPKGYRKRSRKEFDMDDIRDMFGSETVSDKSRGYNSRRPELIAD